jgi:Spy/CpxP family protein refolding chaperone
MSNLKSKLTMIVLTAAFAAGAQAQSAPAADSGKPAAQHEKMDHAKMQAMMQKHIAELHDKLKLTPQQEPAWKTFIDAVKPGEMKMPSEQDRKAMDQLSAPDRMEKHLQMMKERMAKMESRLAALKTFYATLTPEQQKTFDDAHRQMMHHFMHKMQMNQMMHGEHKHGADAGASTAQPKQ